MGRADEQGSRQPDPKHVNEQTIEQERHRQGRARGTGQGHDDEVHRQVDQDSISQSADDRSPGEKVPAQTDGVKCSYDAEGNEVMKESTEKRRRQAFLENSTPKKAGGDALEDPDGLHATKAEEDDRIECIQRADGQSPKDDGPSWAEPRHNTNR